MVGDSRTKGSEEDRFAVRRKEMHRLAEGMSTKKVGLASKKGNRGVVGRTGTLERGLQSIVASNISYKLFKQIAVYEPNWYDENSQIY